MHPTIRHCLQVVVTEGWTAIWDEHGSPPSTVPGGHVLVWDEGEPPPQEILLRRKHDGSGWEVIAQPDGGDGAKLSRGTD